MTPLGLPAEFQVSADEVHVWRAGLNQAPGTLLRLAGILAADERERADRFVFADDRTRHVLGRGLARLLLGHCLGVPADALVFEHNAFGKPCVAGAGGAAERLEFSISHSGDVVLVALARARRVGVDVERAQAGRGIDGIAGRFFSAAECAALASLAPASRQDAFFTCWTRKEAYIKATGQGLSLALASFDVALAPGAPARLLATRPDAGERERWTLQDLDVGEGYKAAVAVEGSGWRLVSWTWDPFGCARAAGGNHPVPEGSAVP